VKLRHQQIAGEVLIESLFNPVCTTQIGQRLLRFFFGSDGVTKVHHIGRVEIIGYFDLHILMRDVRSGRLWRIRRITAAAPEGCA
jgi:hypothetical protein